jgi:hypothetical protein
MNSLPSVPFQPTPAMPPSTDTAVSNVSDVLSELLIDTAEQLSLKLPALAEAQFAGADICPVIPDDLKAEQHADSGSIPVGGR